MSDVTLADIKKAFDDQMNAFEEHKKLVNARVDAVKAEKSTSDFDEKLDRISETLSKSEKIQRDWQKQQDALEAKRAAEELEWKQRRLDDERKFEAKMNRAILGLGGGVIGDEVKGNQILEAKAYAKFLRKGFEKLSQDELKVLTVASDVTGGYLAPPSYVAEIIKAAVLFSPMRGICAVKSIGTGELQQPKRSQTAAATWMSEIGTRSETQNPNWAMMKIPVHELYAEARVSLANIEDSAFNLDAELSQEFSEQFGVTEGGAVCSGDGVGKPLGFLNANAAGPAVPLAFTVSGSAATIAGASGVQADGIVNLYHAVKTPYAMNGRWILNRNSLGKVRLMKETTGQFLWQPGLQAGLPSTILTAPYTEVPDMPDEGAGAFPIGFGDWKRGYTIVDRIEMSITRDPYTVASSGQVKFSARRRVGGQVVLGEAMRLLKCST